MSMQEVGSVFLALLLGHLLGDFLFQPQTQAGRGRNPRRFHWLRRHLPHALMHYLLPLLLLGLFTTLPLGTARLHSTLVLLVVTHLLIERLTGQGEARFFLGQGLHLVALSLCSLLIAGDLRTGTAVVLNATRAHGQAALVVGTIYAGVLFGGGYLIAHLLRPLAVDLERESSPEATRGLARAGRYIGWLERFLVLTAIAGQWPATVGLILAAKSIFRFPELKGEERVRPLAEYFLIGTLLSVALAVLGGLLLRTLLLP